MTGNLIGELLLRVVPEADTGDQVTAAISGQRSGRVH